MGQLHLWDWIVVAAYFVIVIAIALYYYKKSRQNTQEFFLSGRNLPWWLAGTAMVATTFAADTPLAVTELVAQNGIAGNWLWWNMAIGSMLTVFFYARLWRRANILTDVEFVELRYSGKTAAVLRGFRAIYLGFFMNMIVIAWVNKAMEKIFQVTLPGIDSFLLVVVCTGIIAIYASSSGLLGTARIDSLQFVIAIIGCIVLAVIVVRLPEVGGIAGIKAKLSENVFAFAPSVLTNPMDSVLGGTLALSLGAFIAHIGIQWWASWYPGSDPGGGGYIAQRMMSAKDEKHSLFATLWFTVAHYCLRPWPWILVALSAMVLLPRLPMQDHKIIAEYSPAFEIFRDARNHGTDYHTKTNDPVLLARIKEFEDPKFFEKFENTVDPGKMYPKLMVQYLPTGLLGLMLAVFLAAYMSTISAQFNWGTSYLVHDFYRRFIRREAEEKHYVWIARCSILLITIFSLLITKYLLNTISGAWEFIINASAGIGTVLILRWFWWRINAWSEIAAMVAPLVLYPISHYVLQLKSPMSLYPTVIGTTLVWLLVTYLTSPSDSQTLRQFYTKIHPGGWGWKKIARQCPDVVCDRGYGKLFINWLFGVVLVYSVLYATGKILFQEYLPASMALFLALLSVFVIYRNMQEQNN